MRRILRQPEVLAVMGIKKSKLWKDVKDGRFPQPVKISNRCSGWFADEIEELQEKLAAQRDLKSRSAA